MRKRLAVCYKTKKFYYNKNSEGQNIARNTFVAYYTDKPKEEVSRMIDIVNTTHPATYNNNSSCPIDWTKIDYFFISE